MITATSAPAVFTPPSCFILGREGAIFCKDEALRHKIFYSHNFGHNGPLDFYGLGINGKISELQAAMGLAVFPYIDSIISQRKKVIDYYRHHIMIPGMRQMKIRLGTDWNYSYFPVIFESEDNLLKTMKLLNSNNIFPRRYFYPSLNKLPYVIQQNCEVSELIASRILCLPLYGELEPEMQSFIVNNLIG